MDLKNGTLLVSQTEKDKYHMILLICGIKKMVHGLFFSWSTWLTQPWIEDGSQDGL